jgi:hypothetical protein
VFLVANQYHQFRNPGIWYLVFLLSWMSLSSLSVIGCPEWMILVAKQCWMQRKMASWGEVTFHVGFQDHNPEAWILSMVRYVSFLRIHNHCDIDSLLSIILQHHEFFLSRLLFLCYSLQCSNSSSESSKSRTARFSLTWVTVLRYVCNMVPWLM